MKTIYSEQVRLLVNLLPIVEKQNCLAFKGGTAINLFVRDMPRLSVDIDLAYFPIDGRDESLAGIDTAIGNIIGDIGKRIPRAQVMEKIMTMSIQESDWKYLRKREGDMLSTLCGRINEQSKDILNDQSESEHEKYLKMYGLILITMKEGKGVLSAQGQNQDDRIFMIFQE